MSVHGTFTYGLPGKTKDQMIETKNFISDTNFNTFRIGTAEIEGTPLHTLNKKELKNYTGASINSTYDERRMVENSGSNGIYRIIR